MYKAIVKNVFPGVIEQAENEDEKEVVVYGLEIMLSTLVNVFVMLLIGIISHNLFATVIYLLCFCNIRVVAGGFHANTHLSCLLCLTFTYLFIVGINPYITVKYNTALIVIAVISYVVTLWMAPILNGKRTFSTEEIQSAKKKTRLILFIELLVTVGLYLINFELYKFAIYAMITEGVFGIMGKIKYWDLNKKTVLENTKSLALGVSSRAAGSLCYAFWHEPEMPKALKEKLEKR